MKSYKFLSRRSFRGLVTGLLRDYRVYGTVEKDGFPAFSEISDFRDLKLFLTPTHISAKGFLFPPREVLLEFDIEKGTHEAVLEARPQVIIGLHSCDIHAIALLDRVFSYGTGDANYLRRRENTILIGAECMPDEYCFCKSIGTMTVEEGFDLFLHEVKKGFLVRVGSEKGRKILLRHARKATSEEVKELKRFAEKKEKSFVEKLDIERPLKNLPGVYSRSDESPVWDRIGAICYGCGSCNNVCPTCYCFDVRDEVGSDLARGKRVRVWDGCTLEDFAKVAGGHNFRKRRAARLRHRFNRKFNYLSGRFNSLLCVGCGRCSRTCLVLINIAKVTNELIKEWRDKGGSEK